jgi:hypothetical protein
MAIDLEHGVNPGTTIGELAAQNAELLIEIRVDVKCCPRAAQVLLRHAPSSPEESVSERLYRQLSQKPAALALSIALFLACCCICVRRYCCFGALPRGPPRARTSTATSRRRYATTEGEDYDDDDALGGD